MAESSYAVLGMGKYGKRIVDIVSNTGADILIADQDEGIVKQYAPKVTLAVCADLSVPDAIKELGLDSIDVVIVDMGRMLEAEIMCVMIAKEEGVERVIAKASSHRVGKVLEKVGADVIVYPEEEAAERMARTLISEDFLEYINIGDDLCIVKMAPLREWCSKPLNQLNLRTKFHANLLAIDRDGSGPGKYSTEFTPDLVLNKNMRIMILTERQYVFDYI